jgi:hypothetical protein
MKLNFLKPLLIIVISLTGLCFKAEAQTPKTKWYVECTNTTSCAFTVTINLSSGGPHSFTATCGASGCTPSSVFSDSDCETVSITSIVVSGNGCLTTTFTPTGGVFQAQQGAPGCTCASAINCTGETQAYFGLCNSLDPPGSTTHVIDLVIY